MGVQGARENSVCHKGFPECARVLPDYFGENRNVKTVFQASLDRYREFHHHRGQRFPWL